MTHHNPTEREAAPEQLAERFEKCLEKLQTSRELFAIKQQTTLDELEHVDSVTILEAFQMFEVVKIEELLEEYQQPMPWVKTNSYRGTGLVEDPQGDTYINTSSKTVTRFENDVAEGTIQQNSWQTYSIQAEPHKHIVMRLKFRTNDLGDDNSLLEFDLPGYSEVSLPGGESINSFAKEAEEVSVELDQNAAGQFVDMLEYIVSGLNQIYHSGKYAFFPAKNGLEIRASDLSDIEDFD